MPDSVKGQLSSLMSLPAERWLSPTCMGTAHVENPQRAVGGGTAENTEAMVRWSASCTTGMSLILGVFHASSTDSTTTPGHKHCSNPILQ